MKKVMITLVAVVLLLTVNIVSADTFVSADGQSQFDIDFVTISGDTNPSSGYGIVTGDYRIGKYEISNDQFAKFASNNPHFTGADVPSNMVTWFEAAKFVNYLNTSTGNHAAYKFNGGVSAWDVLDIGYDATNPIRNSKAKYFMPTEDEWAKAAYWNDTSLQTYATTDGSTPVAGVDTNYDTIWGVGQPWNVHDGSEELNGTKNMMGNVCEWTESSEDNLGYRRIVRGGSYYDDYIGIRSYDWYSDFPSGGGFGTGFRVASIVPEPASLVLLGLGGLALRRRKR